MHFVTVATHSERYLPTLESQVTDKNHTLVKLGYGQKYQGHFMKDKLLLEYTQNLDKEEIVIFMDGFDTLFLGEPEELLKKFKNQNSKIVLSIENIGSLSFIHKAVFSKYKTKFINTGLFMGYAGELTKFLKEMYSKEFDLNSNQKTWSTFLNNSNYDISLDLKSELFLNHSFTTDNIFKVKNNRIILDTTETPVFIQGNGQSNMDYILKGTKYYKIDKKNSILKNLKYNVKALFSLYYPIVTFYTVLIILGIIILSTMIYLYIKNKKNNL